MSLTRIVSRTAVSQAHLISALRPSRRLPSVHPRSVRCRSDRCLSVRLPVVRYRPPTLLVRLCPSLRTQVSTLTARSAWKPKPIPIVIFIVAKRRTFISFRPTNPPLVMVFLDSSPAATPAVLLMMLTVLAFRRALPTPSSMRRRPVPLRPLSPAARKSSRRSSRRRSRKSCTTVTASALATTCFSVRSANVTVPLSARVSGSLVIAAAPARRLAPLVSVRAIRSLRSALRKRALFLLVRLVSGSGAVEVETGVRLEVKAKTDRADAKIGTVVPKGLESHASRRTTLHLLWALWVLWANRVRHSRLRNIKDE